MPEPTTAATRNAVPTSSAAARRRAQASRSDAAEQRRQVASALGVDAVEDPDAALLAVEQAGLVQHLEVVADGRLGEVEGVVEVADAGLAVRVRGDQREQPQPDRVGERLEQRRDPLGLARRSAARLVSGEQQATVSTGVSSSQRLRHASILTDVDVCGNLDRHRQSSMSQEDTMSRLQLALNVDDLDASIAFYSHAVRHRAGQGPARLRQLRRRRAAAEARADREPRPRRLAQPPRRRGRRHRHRRRRADPPRPRPASPRSTSATRPAATPSRTSSGSRAPPNGERWEIYTVLARRTGRCGSALRLLLPRSGPAARDRRGLGAAGGVELAEDVGDVDRDGLGADEELLGDLAVGPALGDQREDLALARGERVGRGVSARTGGRPIARSSSSSGWAPSRCAASRARSPSSRAPARSPVARRMPARAVRTRASSWTWPKSSNSDDRVAPGVDEHVLRRGVDAGQPAHPQRLGVEPLHPGAALRPPVPGRVGVAVEHDVAVGVDPVDVVERTPRARPPTETASPARPRRSRRRRAGSGH